MHTTAVCFPAAGPAVVDDFELAGTLYLPDQPSESPPTPGGRPVAPTRPAPGLIVGHGAGSRRANHDEFCREACSQGFAVFALDFRGHGESGGTADGPLEQDIFAAAEFLRRRPEIDESHICYRGSSMGGFYGLKAAATGFAFTALALLCPASERVILDALAEFDDEPADTESSSDHSGAPESSSGTRWDVPGLRAYFEKQDSLTLAARVHRPVLLVHARNDTVVPFGHSLALAEQLGGETTLVALPGGSHTTAQHDPRIHRLTARWLLERVTSACTART